MMNERMLELALSSGLLNYIDNETPRHYFVHGNIEIEDIQHFAETIIKSCAMVGDFAYNGGILTPGVMIKEHFGIE